MAKATASPPARRRSGDRPRGKAKTPKYKTKETSPPKHESVWKHEINRSFIAPFLLTRSVHFLAAIWRNLSPPLTPPGQALKHSLNERECHNLCRESSPNPSRASLAGRPSGGRGGADRRGNPRCGQ